jgi:purine-binding chemotaxis protein CheW
MNSTNETANTKHLTFTLDQEFYALDIFSVREIQDMTEVTRIPNTPDYMLGVVNLRGNAVPVVDLRRKFNLPEGKRTLDTRIIILELERNGDTRLVGALADSVKEVLEIEASAVDPAPKMGAAINTDFIRGITRQNDRFIILLDLERIFGGEEDLAALQAEESAPAGQNVQEAA